MSKLQERCNELLDDWQITDPSVKILANRNNVEMERQYHE